MYPRDTETKEEEAQYRIMKYELELRPLGLHMPRALLVIDEADITETTDWKQLMRMMRERIKNHHD